LGDRPLGGGYGDRARQRRIRAATARWRIRRRRPLAGWIRRPLAEETATARWVEDGGGDRSLGGVITARWSGGYAIARWVEDTAAATALGWRDTAAATGYGDRSRRIRWRRPPAGWRIRRPRCGGIAGGEDRSLGGGYGDRLAGWGGGGPLAGWRIRRPPRWVEDTVAATARWVEDTATARWWRIRRPLAGWRI
jgi:hypothetical protein